MIRYYRCRVRYRGSDVMNTVPVMSYIMWDDVIKCGCETLYSVSDVKHIVSAMPYIQNV